MSSTEYVCTTCGPFDGSIRPPYSKKPQYLVIFPTVRLRSYSVDVDEIALFDLSEPYWIPAYVSSRDCVAPNHKIPETHQCFCFRKKNKIFWILSSRKFFFQIMEIHNFRGGLRMCSHWALKLIFGLNHRVLHSQSLKDRMKVRVIVKSEGAPPPTLDFDPNFNSKTNFYPNNSGMR